MSVRARILIVTPDPEIRRSLRFLLEAEGYRVQARDRLPGRLTRALPRPLAGAPDALVLDLGRALPGDLPPGLPLVLLVDRSAAQPLPPGAQVVEKPLLGQDLAEALGRALREGPRTGPRGSPTGIPVVS